MADDADSRPDSDDAVGRPRDRQDVVVTQNDPELRPSLADSEAFSSEYESGTLPNDDLKTRLLRMMVPASLAGGIVALYPAISDRVVERFGAGFRPGLVTIYVATLVLLFLADALLRDLRMLRVRRLVEAAEKRAAIENERARELSLLLELSNLLEGRERIESSILKALDRLREEMPFQCATIYVSDSSSSQLVRRGICPLTAQTSASSASLASVAFETGAEARNDSTSGCLAIPLRAHGETIGALVVEGVACDELSCGSRKTRLVLAAERFAWSLAARRLHAELEEKERSIRQAWRELRMSSRRLASSTARAESAALAKTVANALVDPVTDARGELKRLARLLGCAEGEGPLKKLSESVAALARETDALIARSRWSEKTSPVAVNDLLIAAVDLLAPEFQGSRIEVRLALDPNLASIITAEDALYQLLIRLLQRLRGELRQAPTPRRLTIESLGRGDTARIVLSANTAGIAPSARLVERRDSSPKPMNKNKLRTKDQTWRSIVTAARARVGREQRIGEGVAYTITLLGVKEPRLV